MGEHRLYRDYRYEFGQQLLMLRTRIGLTQSALADELGVHRRSVQNWETGVSYPKAETLQRLIAALLSRRALTPGKEAAEAQALWQQAAADGPHPLPAFDEAWFAALAHNDEGGTHNDEAHVPLQASASSSFNVEHSSLIDWGEALAVPTLYGREREIATLRQWVVDDRCRVVALVGLGGIGKSSLAITFARGVLEQFDVVLFRSLQNGPALAEVLDQAIRAVSSQQATPPAALPDKIAMLVQLFRERRCLLILDNLESIMQPGALVGTYRAGYAEYGDLLRGLSERAHHSCLLLTSREKPAELGPLEGRSAPVRSLALPGLGGAACRTILEAKDIDGTADDLSALARLYGGNPLALTLVAEPIRELFGGDVGAFLAEGDLFFNGVDQLLDQQIGRLSALERDVLSWLAIGREPMDITALRARSTLAAEPRAWLQTLAALRARHLIERGESGATFTLQPVVMEYITAQLIELLLKDILAAAPDTLRRYAVLLAQAPEYVRQSQERLIAGPLLSQLGTGLNSKPLVEARLAQALAAIRLLPRHEQGYAGGNVLNLLVRAGANLRGYDFSDLNVWQAYLADVELPGVDFRGADLAGSRFTEAFKTIVPVAFSPNGEYLATGSIDGEIWLWRVADKQQVALLQGHTGPVNALAFSPDGRTLASGSSDGLIMLWSAEGGARLATLSGHRGRIWSVAWSPDGALLASGSDDQTIKLWAIPAGIFLATLADHGAAVASVAFSPDGATLASASHDPQPTIKCWDVAARACVATLSGHSADIWSVAWSPDGALLASGSADLTIKLWSAQTGALRATLRGHTARIRAVAWHPSQPVLASGSLDQTVKIWDIGALHLRDGQPAIDADAAGGVCRATLAENTGPVNGVAWGPDGDTLAGGGELQTIALWSAARSECLALLYGHNSGVLALGFSPDGATLASAGFDRWIRCWSAADHTVRVRLPGHTGAIYALAWSADGARLVSGSGGSDRTVRIWSIASGGAVATLAEHLGPVMSVAWSADGATIASGSLDWTIKLWSPIGAASLATLRGHTDGVRALAFSPDSMLLASASYDRTVRMWSVAMHRLIHTLEGHSGPVRSIAWSPDGRLLASGSADQTIRLWSAASAACLAVLSGHSGEVVALAFHPDGARLASGSFDGTIRLWDVGAAVGQGAVAASAQVLYPQAGVIYAVAWSRDGRAFASGSAEGAITLWDPHTHRPLATLRGEAPYTGMRLSAATTGLADVQRATLLSLGALDASAPDEASGQADNARQATDDRRWTMGDGRWTTSDGRQAAPISHLPSPIPRLQSPIPISHPPSPSLPYQPTPFIGRSVEIAKITAILSNPTCRLLTLLGPGGVGKTRLAIEIASGRAGAFADGVAFVGLAAVGTPAQIVSAIGDALGLSSAGQSDLQALLLGYLRPRHMLLLLDNFEHLLDGADLVSAILAHAPRVSVLVTSRARLNLQTEWLFDVDGMAYPPADAHATAAHQPQAGPASYSAVQLFLQRANQVQPGLVSDEETLAAIVRICRHVAGMPLAIELAAAGTRTLPISAIEQQIRTNLDGLATTLRDVPARHRSMRAVFDHSWALLTEPERALFSSIAVFRGGWTSAAASAVAELRVENEQFSIGGSQNQVRNSQFSILNLLITLVDKSLLRRESAPALDHADPRFSTSEPVREYAMERLAARPDAEDLRRRHAHYFTALAEAAAAQWDTPQINAAIAQQRREHDNMRAALQWACDTGSGQLGLQLAVALWGFWRSYGYIGEGRAWLERLLRLDEHPTDPAAMSARQRGLHAAAWLASDQHEYATATQLFEQSMGLRLALGETAGAVDLQLNAARQARAVGQYRRATALLEDALRDHRHLRSAGPDLASDDLGQMLRELGLVLREQGQFERATALFEEGLALHRANGDRVSMALELLGLADVARDTGDSAGVYAHGEPCLAILREFGMQWAIGFALNDLALAAFYESDLTRALALADESAALFRDLQSNASLAEVLITLGRIQHAQGHLAAASAALSEALRLALALGPRLMVAAAMEGLAGVLAEGGSAEPAVRLLAPAAALRAQMCTPLWPAQRDATQRARAAARSALGDTAFEAAWAAAAAIPFELFHQALFAAGSAD